MGCRRLSSASNNKQKIKYVEKLRDEITALKAEKSEKDELEAPFEVVVMSAAPHPAGGQER